jgi:hypothetical protein
MCGFTPYTAVIAPRTPISSCVVATLTTLAASFRRRFGQPDQGFADDVRAHLVVECARGSDATVDEVRSHGR